MSHLQEVIARIADPVILSKGAFLVDVVIRGDHGRKMVEIFLDHDKGVSTDLCAQVSREVSVALDEANFFQSRYVLVVSSPGLDRPLKFFRQYQKNLGRAIEVKYIHEGSHKSISGNLTAANEQRITMMNAEQEEISISFDTIVEARVKSAF